MNKQAASSAWLVFIDTNIFLDFYRLPGWSTPYSARLTNAPAVSYYP